LDINFLDNNITVIEVRFPLSSLSGVQIWLLVGVPRDIKNYLEVPPCEIWRDTLVSDTESVIN